MKAGREKTVAYGTFERTDCGRRLGVALGWHRTDPPSRFGHTATADLHRARVGIYLVSATWLSGLGVVRYFPALRQPIAWPQIGIISRNELMATITNDSAGDTMDQDRAALSRSDRRTLDDLFRHPIAHNLAWKDAVGLFERVGSVAEKANHELVFDAGGQTLTMRRPHAKELTTSEVMDLRHFATRAGLSRHGSSPAPSHPDRAAPELLVVVDHHGAKIYHIDVTSDDATRRTITPYDPHHFLHHLTHKDQSRSRANARPRRRVSMSRYRRRWRKAARSSSSGTAPATAMRRSI